MRRLPSYFLPDYDAGCGCETCTTEWGADFPLVRATTVFVSCAVHHGG